MRRNLINVLSRRPKSISSLNNRDQDLPLFYTHSICRPNASEARARARAQRGESSRSSEIKQVKQLFYSSYVTLVSLSSSQLVLFSFYKFIERNSDLTVSPFFPALIAYVRTLAFTHMVTLI